MITFATQEDFEDAVMSVLAHRLRAKVFVHNTDTVKVEMLLVDDESIDGCISFDWDEE